MFLQIRVFHVPYINVFTKSVEIIDFIVVFVVDYCYPLKPMSISIIRKERNESREREREKERVGVCME